MIIIFTGNGKGKTTAALGQAIRALGQGRRVLMIQFIKGKWEAGEDIFISKIQKQKLKIQIKNKKLLEGLENFYDFKIIKTGKGFIGIGGDKLPFSAHKKAAENGWQLFKKALQSNKYDLIILDEINMAVNLKLIKEKEVLKILKPLSVVDGVDIILTGRKAAPSFIKLANIVTDMKEVKYQTVGCRKGIEY